ncbi:unnamed protein product [Anisakis simplex]|uniref:ML domain-containing protein n=1 Tax=Anisakis simplex TaxID=6269 RepID=A0A0M3JX96_ANISI|nr:unnamed protein product [Anisakis simplex]
MLLSLSESNFELISVEAAGCPGTGNSCDFKRGSEPRIRIGFKPNRDVDKLQTTVRAKLGGALVPFNLDNDNPCEKGNLTCPLKIGQTYYYSQSVKILDQYPKVNVQVNWLLNDKSNDESDNDKSKREVCIIFLAKVVD